MLTLMAFVAFVMPQDTIRWTEPECKKCRIEIEQVAVLNSPKLLLRTGSLGIAKGRSSWYAVQSHGDSTEIGIFRFTLDGKFDKKIARWGHGPGEVEAPVVLRVDAHDSLHVLDFSLGKRFVFDPNGQYVRQHSMPRMLSGSFAFTPGGGIVVNAVGMGKQGGWPLYSFDAVGNALGSWPEAKYRYQALDFAASGQRFIAGDYSSRVWVVHGMSHTGLISEIRDSRTGKIISLYRRTGKWIRPLPPPRKYGAPPPKDLIEPHSFAIGATTSNGILWIAYQVSDPNWRRGYGKPKRDENGYILDTPDFDGRRVVDMILDAIDVNTGKLLASRRFDLEMVPSTDGFLVSPFDSGDFHLEVIYRPKLVR